MNGARANKAPMTPSTLVLTAPPHGRAIAGNGISTAGLIARAPTAVTAFVGRTLKGPVHRAVALRSFGEFVQLAFNLRQRWLARAA